MVFQNFNIFGSNTNSFFKTFLEQNFLNKISSLVSLSKYFHLVQSFTQYCYPEKCFFQKIAKNTHFLIVHKNCFGYPIFFIFDEGISPYVLDLQLNSQLNRTCHSSVSKYQSSKVSSKYATMQKCPFLSMYRNGFNHWISFIFCEGTVPQKAHHHLKSQLYQISGSSVIRTQSWKK